MAKHSAHHPVNLNLNVRGLSPSATLAINEKSAELTRLGKTVYRLGLGQSPFPVPQSVVESLKAFSDKKEYLPVRGLYTLRQAVAEHHQKMEGISFTENDVLIGPGSKELIFILQLVYYGELIIPTPSWVSYSPQAKIIGRNVTWIPTQEDNYWRLVPEQLECICRADPDRPRIMVMNYPSNPTGYTYSIENLKELARIARQYNVVLVSDEIYGLLHHEGKHVSIARYYPEGTIISSGLSKWCGAGGWRLGTFTFPESLRWLQDAMAIVASETYTATSAPIQYASICAFKGSEDIDTYLVNVRRILKILARYMVKSFKKVGIDIAQPHGGFYLFPNFESYKEKFQKNDILTSVELCKQLLRDKGIALLPGNDFGRPPGEYSARLAYVDFNGEHALDIARRNFNNADLDDSFVQEAAPKLIKATNLLEEWLGNL